MEPPQTSAIHVLSDTGYNLAPGKVPPDLIDRPDPPLPDGLVTASLRVEPEGKTYFWATAPEARRDLVEWALAWSVRVWSYVDEEKFRECATLANFTRAEIEAVLASIRIHDDSYFRRPYRLSYHPQHVVDARAGASDKQP
jgi:hypothetical protein